MKIQYIEKNFNKKSLGLIEIANAIIAEYEAQGYDLTLRQLYYQMVARGYINNQQRIYKSLGETINNARLAGLVSWEAIVDRTRELHEISTWSHPGRIISAARSSYRNDLWRDQDYRVEVWIEKDALRGVIRSICDRLDLPDFSCRGYSSSSEMWAASQRLEAYMKNDQVPVIIHLGDHDPSGIDMTRDIIDRLELFTGGVEGQDFEVRRAALNMPQVRQFNPPPNPAKLTDSRVDGYIANYGRSSWELDALDPATLDAVISGIVDELRDDDKFDAAKAKQEKDREDLQWLENNYGSVTADKKAVLASRRLVTAARQSVELLEAHQGFNELSDDDIFDAIEELRYALEVAGVELNPDEDDEDE